MNRNEFSDIPPPSMKVIVDGKVEYRQVDYTEEYGGPFGDYTSGIGRLAHLPGVPPLRLDFPVLYDGEHMERTADGDVVIFRRGKK